MESGLVYDLYTSKPSNITVTLPSIAPGVFSVTSSQENIVRIVKIVNIVSIFQEKNEKALELEPLSNSCQVIHLDKFFFL